MHEHAPDPDEALPEGIPRHGTDDAFGHMVYDYWRGEYDGSGVYRDPWGRTRDGHPEWYFGAAIDRPVPETREAMDRAAAAVGRTGAPVLDLGCGAGQHSLQFEVRGTPAIPADPSLLALVTAREMGLERTLLADLNAVPLDPDTVGAVFMAGTQLGNAGGGTVEGLRRALVAFDRIVADGGRVVADIKTPVGHLAEADGSGNDANDLVHVDEERGVGLRRMRTEYAGRVGRWVDLLLLTPAAAERAVEGTPWRLVETLRGEGARYYLVLER